jgi:hypothetical protein
VWREQCRDVMPHRLRIVATAEAADLARWIITTLLLIAFGIPLIAAASALRKWRTFSAEKSDAERKYEIAEQLAVQEQADRDALTSDGWTNAGFEAMQERHQRARREAGLRTPTAGEWEAELASGRAEYERPHFAPVTEVAWGCRSARVRPNRWPAGYVVRRVRRAAARQPVGRGD